MTNRLVSPLIPFLLILIFLDLLSLSPVWAQTAQPKAPEYTFRTLGLDCAPEGLHYLSGSNSINLTVLSGMRSEPQSYMGASPIVFFKTIPGNDGHMTNIPVVSVDFSGAGTFPLLLFTKGATEAASPKVRVLPEDATAFPGGTFRVLNNTVSPLSVSFGSSKMVVPPFSMLNHKAESQVLTMEMTSMEPAGSRQVMRANVGILPDSRILLLATPSKLPGSPIEVQRHSDTVPGR